MHMKLNFKRLMAMFLSIIMVVGLLPTMVFAEDAAITAEETEEGILADGNPSEAVALAEETEEGILADGNPSEAVALAEETEEGILADGNPSEAVALAEGQAVAKVGNTAYGTIDEAIANWTNGTTLTLLADVTLPDVIKISSTEYHILDLGTYTMTAAGNKDAIQIVNNGRSSASYALDIKADAANPGGITATGKAVVKTTGKSDVKDRPIIRFYNGVFNASNIVSHSGSKGTNCPQFQFHGGVFNGSIFTNRALNQFYGGTFTGQLWMSVDSSAYTLVKGGTFKNLSNVMRSELNSDKFVIGTSKGANNGSVCIDENGYYVISTTTPTTAEASVASNYDSNNYFYYSTVNTDGMYYKDVYMALEKNTTGTVTVFIDALGLGDSAFEGTIVVLEGKTLTITVVENEKAEWNVSAEGATVKYVDQNGKTLEKNDEGYFIDPNAPTDYAAKIGDVKYADLASAINAAQEGETVTLIKNVTLTDTLTIPENMDIILDLNGKTISQSKACTASYSMIENKGGLTITGNGKISFTDTGAGDPNFGWGSYTLTNRGTLVVENGTIENLSQQNKDSVKHMYCAIQQSAGTVTINGGTFATSYYRSVRVNGGDLIINGGTFNGQVWIQPNQADTTLTVTGGTFAPAGVDGSSIFLTNEGENKQITDVDISGGIFTTKIGATNSEALFGAITGGLFTEAAKNGTNTALLGNNTFSGEVNEDGYYTVVAQAVATTYTVTFDSSGGSAVASQTVKEGGKITKPANPTRSGYTFLGWFYQAKAWDFNQLVTSSMTLQARWLIQSPGSGSGGSSSSDSDSGSSGGGFSSTPSASLPSTVTTAAANNAAASAAQAAQASGAASATARLQNPSDISLATLQSMVRRAGMPLNIQADSMNGNAVDVRINLDPSKAATDLDLSASTTNSFARRNNELFSKYFRNNVMTISLGQQGSFGQSVRIAAKIDPKLNTKNLVFYAYNKTTNSYTLIAEPSYWVDPNGYVHFTTTLAGNIVISDGALKSK
jgi:hypothetical protein